MGNTYRAKFIPLLHTKQHKNQS